MPSELILQFRITQAAKDAARAVQNHDQAAYAKARQRYYHYDLELQKLEKVRNERAIAELVQSAKRIEGFRWLSHAQIEKSGVPVEVLHDRGWQDTDYGMRRPARPPLKLIRKVEPQGTEP